MKQTIKPTRRAVLGMLGAAALPLAVPTVASASSDYDKGHFIGVGAAANSQGGDLLVGTVISIFTQGSFVLYRNSVAGTPPTWPTNFTHWKQIPGRIRSPYEPSVVRVPGRNYVAVIDADEHLVAVQVYRDEDNDPMTERWNTDWLPIPGSHSVQPRSAPTMVYVPATNSIVITVVGVYGYLWRAELNLQTQVWSKWTAVNLPGPVRQASSVAMAVLNGRVALAMVGIDRRIFVGELVGLNAVWSEVGGNTDRTPALAVLPGNRLVVIVQEAGYYSGRLCYQSVPISPVPGTMGLSPAYGGPHWEAQWKAVPGNGKFDVQVGDGGPKVSGSGYGKLHIYHRSTDTQIWTTSVEGLVPGSPFLKLSAGFAGWQLIPQSLNPGF
jgi:hypothetical protein